MNNPRTRNIMIYVTIGLAILLTYVYLSSNSTTVNTIQFSEFARQVRSGNVSQVEVRGDELNITFENNSRAISNKSPETDALQQLTALGVTTDQLSQIDWTYRPSRNSTFVLLPILSTLLPILLIVGLFVFVLRQSQGANNQAMSFGKSRARMFSGDRPTVNFNDVAGCDEAKVDLQEIVEFLKEPEKFVQLGARIPRGVLMVGPPGTGKTLLSKAVAGEAGVPFFSISGSEFVEMFVGVGASRVRDLFEQAKRHSPAIIFIDEIDAVGRQRGTGLGGSHDEREQTLNQILVEMDGFDTDTNIIVIAATNRPDILDPALMRAGRFDRRVVIDRPDVKGREDILKVHVRGKPLASDVDLSILARATPGFAGADLENMVNEGAILAARKNKRTINLNDLQEAIERATLGPERKSRIMSEKERKITAYHEAGHAVVGHLFPNTDPVNKVTIIPRGMAGGVTYFLPTEEIHYVPRERLKAQLVIALGGRAAEELIFGEITTGAASDIQQVTRIARAMVARYGMSDKLGPMMFGQKEEMVFLGREISEQRDYSEAIAEEIDAEVRGLVEWAYQQAKTLLSENLEALERVAQYLLQAETIGSAEFGALMNGNLPAPAPRHTELPSAKKSSEDDSSNRPALGNPAPRPI